MAEVGGDGHLGLLVEHVRRALIGHLGATTVDVWLGKDGLERHDVDELARVAVEALATLLDTPEARATAGRLHADGVIAPTLIADGDHW